MSSVAVYFAVTALKISCVADARCQAALGRV
jgi:hypothetical protein